MPPVQLANEQTCTNQRHRYHGDKTIEVGLLMTALCWPPPPPGSTVMSSTRCGPPTGSNLVPDLGADDLATFRSRLSSSGCVGTEIARGPDSGDDVQGMSGAVSCANPVPDAVAAVLGITQQPGKTVSESEVRAQART